MSAPIVSTPHGRKPFAFDTEPVRFSSEMEKQEKDEDKTAHELRETLLDISQKTFDDGGHALRSVHAKAHGLLRGQFEIMRDLPQPLAQGLFAKPAQHDLFMRLSTSPGDILPDSVSTPRGMAIKIIGVEGARLPSSEGDATQDFLFVNGPAFLTPTAAKFLANLKMLAKTTDKAEGLKQAFSAVLRGTETLVEAFGGESSTIKSLGGHPETNLLGETFYTQVPLLYGDYIAKLSVAPQSPALTALKNAPVALSDRDNGLREEVTNFFRDNGGVWELRAQLCTDLKAMPIEDASVPWAEDKSPFIPVALIRIQPQPAYDADRVRSIDDGLSFSPWHGLAAHRPLGSVMRVRKSAYEASAKFRGQKNGCPIHEPKSARA